MKQMMLTLNEVEDFIAPPQGVILLLFPLAVTDALLRAEQESTGEALTPHLTHSGTFNERAASAFSHTAGRGFDFLSAFSRPCPVLIRARGRAGQDGTPRANNMSRPVR
eukprot:987175-Rhodomonas_salina.1